MRDDPAKPFGVHPTMFRAGMDAVMAEIRAHEVVRKTVYSKNRKGEEVHETHWSIARKGEEDA